MNVCDIGIFFGRAERSRLLAQHLRARGFQVTVYNNQGDPGTYVRVTRAFLPALARLCTTRHDAYLSAVSFAPSFCLYLNRMVRGIPYVFNATGLMSAMVRERSRRWWFPGLAERWVYPFLWERVLAGASWIVCNSEYLRDRLAAEYPRYAGKMATVYNGVEFERFETAREASVEARGGGMRLVTVMTWNYEGKTGGARLLIDAMGRIVERHPRARLIIAAKAEDRRYARGIEAYLAEKPWRESVRIYYNRSDIPDLLAGSDLFLYATPCDSNDSLPRVLLEAQAAGLAVVATGTAGCAEAVEDSVSGYVVSYDAGEMAERAMELLADPEKREEMGRRGRERVRERFRWERMGDGYAKLLSRIAADPVRSARIKMPARRIEDRG